MTDADRIEQIRAQYAAESGANTGVVRELLGMYDALAAKLVLPRRIRVEGSLHGTGRLDMVDAETGQEPEIEPMYGFGFDWDVPEQVSIDEAESFALGWNDCIRAIEEHNEQGEG